LTILAFGVGFLSSSATNGLRKESFIRLNKLATIAKDLIIGRIGTLDIKEINTVAHKLKEVLRL